jgi:very-short-patch-repair endonuclease
VVRAGLPEPVVAHPVFDEHGRFIGTPDLAFVAEKVALEYEGDVHRTDLRTFRQDIERRERFQEAGWLVIRITADHLRSPGTLVARIQRALARRSH